MTFMARAAHDERFVLPQLREFADRMFSRAGGAPLIGGNQVRLLVDGYGELYRRILALKKAVK